MLLLLGCFSPDPSTVSHQIEGVPGNVEHALLGLRTGRNFSLSVLLVGEVGAVASSGSGQKGAPRSTELSRVRCSTMCRNGSKQQYLTRALKSSLLKSALVLSKRTCCSITVAGGTVTVAGGPCRMSACLLHCGCRELWGCYGSCSSLLGTLKF